MDFNKPTQKKIDRQKEREAEAVKLKKQQDEILSKVSKNKEDADKKANAARAMVKQSNAATDKPKVIQRLVRKVFVDERKRQGWRIVKNDVRDKHKRTLGVKTFDELVLMKKSN